MKIQKVLILEPQDVDSFYGEIFERLAPSFREKGFEFLIQSVPSAQYEYETIKSYCNQYAPNILVVNDAYLTDDIVKFCENMRKYPETKQIGLFIISSYGCINADDKWWGKWIGSVDEYMTAPFDISELEIRLNKIVKRAVE